MTWQMFRVTYELVSPLHVGYHKFGGNLQRTRYYLPARNMWAAVTERLTRGGFSTANTAEGDYQKIGAWAKEHCAFSYWFVRKGDNLLSPKYADDGLHYGDLRATDFERLYLASHVTTALDVVTTSAQDGSLHEVECIAPRYKVKNGDEEKFERTKLCGWVFLDETALSVLGDESKWRAWLGDLQVGGERRYGFGQLRLEKFESVREQNWRLDGTRPRVRIEKETPLRAHTVAHNVNARGMIEPLVGRETRGDSRTFGQTLTEAKVCWMPGSVVAQEMWLTVGESGRWQRDTG